MRARRLALLTATGAIATASIATASGHASAASGQSSQGSTVRTAAATSTPIQHLVVIFQENVSFDHYFGTYPNAANTDGSPFHARPDTPSVNGLSPALLNDNPNGANPSRLSPAQALTCDQDHDYTPEQKAMDGGANDAYIANTQVTSCSAPDTHPANVVLDYYDGNTVTALWNYAQHFALSDNSFNTQFGPSTPGALNLISGQTHGATMYANPYPDTTPGSDTTAVNSNSTVFGDDDPYYDDCSGGPVIQMTGTTIGDLLNTAGVSWGWFQGGFRPTSVSNSGVATCGSSHTNIVGANVKDYSPHHEPFQYYASTANPHHTPPASVAEIGHAGPANHQYDLTDFSSALAAGDLPAVSFLKAAKYQDGHAGYSDPLDEQTFLVNSINAIEQSKYWSNTAIVISYDDSDGWYDHVVPPIVNSSQDSSEDALDGTTCGHAAPLGGFQDRCGYGPRLPLLVISPFARQNDVDNTLTDQSSILRFVEDNWLAGERIGGGSYDALAGSLDSMFDFRGPKAAKLILDPTTGERQPNGNS